MDYDKFCFKVLTYLNAVCRRKIVFDDNTFKKAIGIENESELAFMLHLMMDGGLIDGLAITKAWGNVYIIASDLSTLTITHQGMMFLLENSTMVKLKTFFLGHIELITDLIKFIG